eukprot:2451950-Amphidinium_carterae.1
MFEALDNRSCASHSSCRFPRLLMPAEVKKTGGEMVVPCSVTGSISWFKAALAGDFLGPILRAGQLFSA